MLTENVKSDVGADCNGEIISVHVQLKISKIMTMKHTRCSMPFLQLTFLDMVCFYSKSMHFGKLFWNKL